MPEFEQSFSSGQLMVRETPNCLIFKYSQIFSGDFMSVSALSLFLLLCFIAHEMIHGASTPRKYSLRRSVLLKNFFLKQGGDCFSSHPNNIDCLYFL